MTVNKNKNKNEAVWRYDKDEIKRYMSLSSPINLPMTIKYSDTLIKNTYDMCIIHLLIGDEDFINGDRGENLSVLNIVGERSDPRKAVL